MYGDWRLVNQKELYNIKNDPGQTNNIIEENTLLAEEMQNFYDKWWDEASNEFSYTFIDIEPNVENVLTSHDIHVDNTPWHQKNIRSGLAFESGGFSVNFKNLRTYDVILRRWPAESKLSLNTSIKDGRPAEKHWDELINGKKMNFKSAYLILDEEKKTIEVNPSDHVVRFTVYKEAGKKKI